MKQFLAFLLAAVVSVSTVGAAGGDGNIDIGGGDIHTGNTGNYWNAGDEGVRITVVQADTGQPATSPIDLSNKSAGTVRHFGKVSKIGYRNGTTLSMSASGYTCIRPTTPIPTIISSSNSQARLDAIKRYFCSEYTAKLVANTTGFNYEKLVGGGYKLLLEPIAYFTFGGKRYAMTATEAALYDQKASGGLKSKMGSLTHKNLPYAMFLETADLGFSTWTGATNRNAANADIIAKLGLGIVRYHNDPTGELEAPDVEYRVDTDVITSITLNTTSRITPDNPATVFFEVNGITYHVRNIVIPADESQVVWIKWHTPSTPQTLTVRVHVNGAYSAQDTFQAKIIDLNENPPPDPQATDTRPGYCVPNVPAHPQRTSVSWGVWSCHWHAIWVWHSNWVWVGGEDGHWEDHGEWVDEGDWEYDYTGYTASLSGRMMLLPDDMVPTANGKTMKSGYGVKTEVNTVLSTDAPGSHFTTTQTALSTFPEFHYRTYNRLLQRINGGRSVIFTYQSNPHSVTGRAVHFTPVWYPNHQKYTVYTQVWDTWTPAGMLSINLTDFTTIEGSLFDDWYTSRE